MKTSNILLLADSWTLVEGNLMRYLYHKISNQTKRAVVNWLLRGGLGWPKEWRRTWLHSSGTSRSSSGSDRLDSRVLATTPAGRDASPWSSPWAAPARTVLRSRGGTCPGKSVGVFLLWTPLHPPTLEASYQRQTVQCLRRSHLDWTNTPWSFHWPRLDVNLFYQQEHFWIPTQAFL